MKTRYSNKKGAWAVRSGRQEMARESNGKEIVFGHLYFGLNPPGMGTFYSWCKEGTLYK